MMKEDKKAVCMPGYKDYFIMRFLFLNFSLPSAQNVESLNVKPIYVSKAKNISFIKNS